MRLSFSAALSSKNFLMSLTEIFSVLCFLLLVVFTGLSEDDGGFSLIGVVVVVVVFSPVCFVFVVFVSLFVFLIVSGLFFFTIKFLHILGMVELVVVLFCCCCFLFLSISLTFSFISGLFLLLPELDVVVPAVLGVVHGVLRGDCGPASDSEHLLVKDCGIGGGVIELPPVSDCGGELECAGGHGVAVLHAGPRVKGLLLKGCGVSELLLVKVSGGEHGVAVLHGAEGGELGCAGGHGDAVLHAGPGVGGLLLKVFVEEHGCVGGHSVVVLHGGWLLLLRCAGGHGGALLRTVVGFGGGEGGLPGEVLPCGQGGVGGRVLAVLVLVGGGLVLGPGCAGDELLLVRVCRGDHGCTGGLGGPALLHTGPVMCGVLLRFPGGDCGGAGGLGGAVLHAVLGGSWCSACSTSGGVSGCEDGLTGAVLTVGGSGNALQMLCRVCLASGLGGDGEGGELAGWLLQGVGGLSLLVSGD